MLYKSLFRFISANLMEQTKQSVRSKPDWFFQGLVLAAIPAVAYMLAFSFELGYASYFHIPISLISLSTAQFCVALISLISIGVTGFLMVNSLHKIFLRFTYKNKNLNEIILRWSLIVILVVIALSYMGAPTKGIFVVVAVLIACLAILDLLVTPQFRKLNAVINKGEEEYNQSLQEQSPWLRVERAFGIRLGNLILSSLVLLLLAFSVGNYSASHQVGFLVQEGTTPLVVVRTYDGNMVTTIFDPETRKVLQTFVIRKIGDDPNALYVQEDIGPLISTPAKTK